MSKTSEILAWMQKFPNTVFDAGDLHQSLGYKKETIRSAFARLVQQNKISRTGRGEYVANSPDQLFLRKYVSGLFYCGGKKKQYYALTFENNNTDREFELINFLELQIQNKCSDMRTNHGYSQMPISFTPKRNIYPDMEFGQLN